MSDKSGASDFSEPAGAQDPSMEEILASIRRILAEEQDGSKFLEEPEGELLLDNSMRLPLPDDPIIEQITESVVEEAPPPSYTTPDIFMEPDERPKMEDQIQRPEGLIGEQVTNQVVNSVGSLLRNIGADRSTAIGRPGLTLEDMVREELKPMLKAWLDTNLPELVERVVRTEIGRLVDIAQN